MGEKSTGRPTNQRQMRRNSERRLVIATLLTLTIVGGGLIGLIYGWAAVLTAMPCLVGGAAVIWLAYWLLGRLEQWRDRY